MNDKVKILHIATIDVGGSYNAAKRLNEMLLKYGYDSQVLVRTKTKLDSEVIEAFDSSIQAGISKAKNIINLLMKRGELKRDILGMDLRGNKSVKEADVIFIHWVSTFLAPKQIYQLSMMKDKKVIFVMHDMWLFTGGCHVDRRCGGYKEECVNCPMAGVFASKSFNRKKRWIEKANLTITGPSNWIVDEARKSSIVKGKKLEVLPNTYDSSLFYSVSDEEKSALRKELGISLEKNVILFGAADTGTKNSNKGFGYLLQALSMIDMSNIQLCVMGNADSNAKALLDKYDVVYTGFIVEEHKLADIYRVSDVFVNPSLQESFGYTVCEAMACGTPAVAFAVGGMLDQINHKESGYLAEFCNSKDLADGIGYVISNHEVVRDNAAQSAKRYSYENMIEKVEEIIRL